MSCVCMREKRGGSDVYRNLCQQDQENIWATVAYDELAYDLTNVSEIES